MSVSVIVPCTTRRVSEPFGPRPMRQSCQLPPPPPLGELALEPASTHQFQRPLWYDEPPLLAPWSFVAEQGGSIYIYDEIVRRRYQTYFLTLR